MAMFAAAIIIEVGGKHCVQGALSEYFYTPAHSIFIATLIGFGTLFFIYRGSSDTEDALLKFPTANVGIAVAAPQGLVVPVLRSVERQSLAEIATGRGEIVGRARDNKLTTQDLEDGTFTISNLGMFGIEQFVAVINPPQAAILAVGATVDTPVARDGAVVIRPMLTMTLTVDHRAVDGADGADFLRTVKQFVEEPALAL